MNEYNKRRDRLLSQGIFEPTAQERAFHERMMAEYRIAIYGLDWQIKTATLPDLSPLRVARLTVMLDPSRSKWANISIWKKSGNEGVIVHYEPSIPAFKTLWGELLDALPGEYERLPGVERDPYDRLYLRIQDLQASARVKAYQRAREDLRTWFFKTFDAEGKAVAGSRNGSFFALVNDRALFDRLCDCKPAAKEAIYDILKKHDPLHLIQRENCDFSLYLQEAISSREVKKLSLWAL